jgi:alkylated DNA repair protein (DNA oxidative demethylase)
MRQLSLYIDEHQAQVPLAEGAVWLRGFAQSISDALSQTVITLLEDYPPQTMMTPMGYPMSVKTTSLGKLGWVSSACGYGYARKDPTTNLAWPEIPTSFLHLAISAAELAGYQEFQPDCCLINVYTIGTKMGLHQDKDERDFSQPIVSVSLGIPAVFLFGGAKRSDVKQKCLVQHGDVVVWGGKSRRFYHGIHTIKPNRHALLGEKRYNLTFRRAD